MIAVTGEVGDEVALRDIPKIWEEHPEVLGFGTLVDLTKDAGSISWSAVKNIAQRWQRFADGRDAGRRTAIVVRDDVWARYARAISTLFPGRHVLVFRNLLSASEWLASRSGSNEGSPARA